MYKPKNLQTVLTDAVPQLQSNPEKLTISIENGRLVSTLASSLSFENQYTLKLTIVGFVGDIETLFVPIMAWLRTHRADMMTTETGRRNGFSYVAVPGEGESFDVVINLQLTERTLVAEVDGELQAGYAPEPQPPEPVTRPVQLYVHGELVSEWHE